MIKYNDGKAGQRAKSEAQRRIRRILGRISVTSAIGGLAIGLPLGYACSGIFPIPVKHPLGVAFALFSLGIIGLELLPGVVVWWLLRSLDRPVHKLSIERLKYLKGGEAETLVAWQMEQLNDSWHLFNNIEMKGSGDVDHVLVGPGGLFALSTKASRGIYSLEGNGRVLLNGRVTDHVRDAQDRAMTLRHWLEARLQPLHEVKKVPFVQPVLVVPFAYIDIPPNSTNVIVAREGELLDFAREAKRSLNSAEVDGCVKILTELSGYQRRPAADTSTA